MFSKPNKPELTRFDLSFRFSRFGRGRGRGFLKHRESLLAQWLRSSERVNAYGRPKRKKYNFGVLLVFEGFRARHQASIVFLPIWRTILQAV